MTVPAQTPYSSAVGNGVTTVFPYAFLILDDDDLVVEVTDTTGAVSTKVNGVDYTVSGVGNVTGGNVTFTTAPSSLYGVVTYRSMAIQRAAGYGTNGDLAATVLNLDFDRIILMLQQLLTGALGAQTALRVPANESISRFPKASSRAGYFPVFDAGGDVALSSGTGTDAGLRADLAATGGSALVSLLQSGVGAVSMTLQSFLRGLFITPAQFGAVGNGVTDDTTAWTRALTAAAGRPIVGDPTKVYAITGNLVLPAVTRIRDCAFKQLLPNDPDRRSLWFQTGTLCELTNVKVDRNGTGVGGTTASAAGIYIASCTRALLVDCEVTGADYGIGIAIVDCDEFRLTRPYVHDIRGGNAAGAVLIDDAVQGIWIVRGLRGVIEAPRIDNLTTQWLAQAEWTRFTRGIAVSGAADLQIITPTVDSVDQGIDISGSDNPDRVVVLGGSLNNCRTWGGKCANTVTFSRWIGVTARNCGLGGFVCSGWATGPVETNSIIFDSCVSLGTGAGGFWAANTPAGFVILNGGGAFTAYPRGVRFVNCLADGIGGLMKYGFYSDTVYQANEYWNETVNCTVRNHTVGKYSATTGFMQGICTRYRAAVQSIPNNAQTAITFDTTQIDRMNGVSGTTSQIVITKSGVYSISGTCAFAGNATNTRALRVLRNGTPIPGCKAGLPGNASVIAFTATAPCACDPGDLITMEVFQDSGGALNTSAGDVVLSVVLVNADRGLA